MLYYVNYSVQKLFTPTRNTLCMTYTSYRDKAAPATANATATATADHDAPRARAPFPLPLLVPVVLDVLALALAAVPVLAAVVTMPEMLSVDDPICDP